VRVPRQLGFAHWNRLEIDLPPMKTRNSVRRWCRQGPVMDSVVDVDVPDAARVLVDDPKQCSEFPLVRKLSLF
jgi:hypothetical protein